MTKTTVDNSTHRCFNATQQWPVRRPAVVLMTPASPDANRQGEALSIDSVDRTVVTAGSRRRSARRPDHDQPRAASQSHGPVACRADAAHRRPHLRPDPGPHRGALHPAPPGRQGSERPRVRRSSTSASCSSRRSRGSFEPMRSRRRFGPRHHRDRRVRRLDRARAHRDLGCRHLPTRAGLLDTHAPPSRLTERNEFDGLHSPGSSSARSPASSLASSWAPTRAC